MITQRRTAREALAEASWIELLTVALGVLGFLLSIAGSYQQLFPKAGSLTISLTDLRILDLTGPTHYSVRAQLTLVNKSENDFVLQRVDLLRLGKPQRTPKGLAQSYFRGLTSEQTDTLPLIIPSHRTQTFVLSGEYRADLDNSGQPGPPNPSDSTSLVLQLILIPPSGVPRVLHIEGIQVARGRMTAGTSPVSISDQD